MPKLFCEVSILIKESDKKLLEEILFDIGIKKDHLNVRTFPESDYTKEEYVFIPSIEYKERCINCGDPKKTHISNSCSRLHDNVKCKCVKFIST